MSGSTSDSQSFRIGVLVSGRGSNLRALHEARSAGFGGQVVACVSNKAECGAEAYARAQSLPWHHADIKALGLQTAESGIIEFFQARKVDYVIGDTAGRLHTKANLMAELDKMRRTAARVIPGAPHEVLLVVDGTTGQNGLEQARKFTETSGVTGIVLTKLDGTAKGGVVVSIARELNLPIRYIGVGEQVGDLMPFNAPNFVSSLFEA